MLTKRDIALFTKDMKSFPSDMTRDELIDFILERQKKNKIYCSKATTRELRILCKLNNINIKIQGAGKNEIQGEQSTYEVL